MQDMNLNESYIGDRPDILKLVSGDPNTVLDVGCSVGSLSRSLKNKTNACVTGIELSSEMAGEAEKYLDKVYTGDAAEIIQSGALEGQRYDLIIFADLLEHLIDPWSVLKASTRLLNKDGYVITSIPNIRHISTIYSLVVKGDWPHRDRGIHDRTHLRFFTKKTIFELFEQAGLSIEIVHTNYRIFERPCGINSFAKLLGIPLLKNYFAFQYLIKAKTK